MNKIIDDKRLPFIIEVTRGLSVYFRLRASSAQPLIRIRDVTHDKKRDCLIVIVNLFKIEILGTDIDGNLTYNIFSWVPVKKDVDK